MPFPQYTDKEVETILTRERAVAGRVGYAHAVNLTVKLMYRHTQSLMRIRRLANLAYEQYRARVKGAPAAMQGPVLTHGIQEALNALKPTFGRADIRYDCLRLQPHEQDEEEAGPSGRGGAGAGPSTAAVAARVLTGNSKLIADAQGVDLSGVPVLGKFLLLAAYIASRNEKGLDADLFNIGPTRFRRNRRTTKGVSTSDVLDMRRREAHNRAPSLFTVDRLLAIYWRMYENESRNQDEAAFANMDEEEIEAELAKDRRLALSCSIMHELASLETSHLLQCVDGEGSWLVGTSELRCNLPDAAAKQLADSVNVKLSSYVLYTN